MVNPRHRCSTVVGFYTFLITKIILKYIPRNMHPVRALLCFVIVNYFVILTYSYYTCSLIHWGQVCRYASGQHHIRLMWCCSGLLPWHWSNHTIAPVSMILHTTLLWLKSNVNQNLNPQNTSIPCPIRRAMGCFKWGFWRNLTAL